MKDIVIIANFCRDFSETDNGRFMYLCKELSRDHKVEIVTSSFNHDTKQQKKQLIHKWPFTITFLWEPGYKKNISVKRFMSHRTWGKEVEKYLEKRCRPDVVYCAVPSLTASYVAAKYCEKNGIRFIIDIQDLWPEAFQMVFHIPIISDIVFAPIKRRADEIYKRADAICGVSKLYIDRALKVNTKCKSGHVAFLGTKLETFDANVNNTEPILRKPHGDEIWLGYCGALSDSYDIPCVISALMILKKETSEVLKFLVMGDGAKRLEYERKASEAEINAVFLGKLSYDQMCAQLVQCDIVINPIVKGSAASIINKHGDYASSGLPVVNTQESIEYRNLIDEYNMGLNCDNGNAIDVSKKIKQLIDNPGLRLEMGKNARRCAEERFDRKKSYGVLIECILN